MTKLLLVRHGITEFNKGRRFAGQSDVELSADGYTQVEKLRRRLANEKIDAVYSSDLKRALVTAEVISPGHKTDIVACPELREMNYGHAEGLTFKEIKSRYPEVAELITNFNLRLEFPDGEGFGGFTERVVRFLDRLEKHEPSETILVVCHGGPLRTLVCHLLGIAQDHWWQIRFDNASLSIVDTYPKGAIISLLNGTSHLRDNA
ncbi:histidine phosphatase family protein [Chloroflexota bacterium]